MSAKQQIANVNYRHMLLADLLIAEPNLTNAELGARCAIGEAQVSIIKNSDAFQEYFALRRKQHEARISRSLVERVEDVADEVVEAIMEKLTTNRDDIPLSTLNDTAKIILAALGLGGGRGGGLSVHVGGDVTIGNVDADLLNRARERMRSQAQVIEGEVVRDDDSANDGGHQALAAAE